jgi:mannan endo-1,4-beta-mannosidase
MLAGLAVVAALAASGLAVPAAGAASPAASAGRAQASSACRPGPGSFVSRDGSALCAGPGRVRFGGANIYWLGLDENVGGIAYPTRFRIADALETAKDMGATVIRCQTCGISTGNPLSIEPSLGQFNSQAFNTIDYTLYLARKLGLRVTIPLTDYWNYYLGSVYDFAQWLGQPACTSSTYACPSQAQFFYTDPGAVKAFEDYISHLVSHVNRYTGVAYKDDPSIMYWELCNECNGMAGSWIDTISAYLHRVAGHQLVAAGQQSGINQATLTAPDVDVVDVHYYPPTPAQVQADAADITAAHKAYVAGEYASTSASQALTSAIAGDQDVTGANFWSLFAHNDTYGYVQHNDGFTLHFPGDTPAMQQAGTQIRALDYAMAGSAVPPLPAPGQPLITSITRQGSGNVVAWRGSTDASAYTVQRSQAGPHGPWSTACDRCASDNQTPWTDTSTPAGTVWYQVIAYAPDGAKGPASPVAEAGPGS